MRRRTAQLAATFFCIGASVQLAVLYAMAWYHEQPSAPHPELPPAALPPRVENRSAAARHVRPQDEAPPPPPALPPPPLPAGCEDQETPIECQEPGCPSRFLSCRDLCEDLLVDVVDAMQRRQSLPAGSEAGAAHWLTFNMIWASPPKYLHGRTLADVCPRACGGCDGRLAAYHATHPPTARRRSSREEGCCRQHLPPGAARQVDAARSVGAGELMCVCEDYQTGARTAFGDRSGYLATAPREPRAWLELELALDAAHAPCRLALPATARHAEPRALCCAYYRLGCQPAHAAETAEPALAAALAEAREAALRPYRQRVLFASSDAANEGRWRLRHAALQDGVALGLAAAACWAAGWSKPPLYRPKRFLVLGVRGALVAAFFQAFVPRCQLTLIEEDAARAALLSSSFDWQPHRGLAQGALYSEPFELFLSREADATGYGVVVVDLLSPALSLTKLLYSKAFARRVDKLLAADGLILAVLPALPSTALEEELTAWMARFFPVHFVLPMPLGPADKARRARGDKGGAFSAENVRLAVLRRSHTKILPSAPSARQERLSNCSEDLQAMARGLAPHHEMASVCLRCHNHQVGYRAREYLREEGWGAWLRS